MSRWLRPLVTCFFPRDKPWHFHLSLFSRGVGFWVHRPVRHLRIASSVIFLSFHTKGRRKTPFFLFPHAGFRRKEFRGKLAIAITANFINRNSTAEAKVEEISGVAFIFNQKFFQDLKEETGGTFTLLQSRPSSSLGFLSSWGWETHSDKVKVRTS